MRSYFLRKTILALLLAAFGSPCHGADVGPGAYTAIDPKDVEVTFVPEKASIMIGEPVCVLLVVKNNSAAKTELFAYGDEPWESRMVTDIHLVAVDKAGTVAPENPWTLKWDKPRTFSPRKGLEPQPIAPGESATLSYYLPKWVVFDHPGVYTISASATLPFFGANGQERTDCAIKAGTSIEVLPADKVKLGELIDALEKIVDSSKVPVQIGATPQPYRIGFDAARRLSFITDERVIPYYRQQIRAGDFSMLGALAQFNNDDALDGLKEGLKITRVINPSTHKSDPEALRLLHISTCECLMRSPHPGAMPYLISQARHPDLQVRLKVMEAVAVRLPPADAIPLLEKLQHDPEKWVGQYATRYLKLLKAGKPVVIMHPAADDMPQL